MSWEVLFLGVGVLLLAGWGYHAVKDQRNFNRSGQESLMLRDHYEESVPDLTAPDVFDESRIRSDLMRLANNPLAIGKYIAQAQVRFTQWNQIKVLQSWTKFYDVSREVIDARAALESSFEGLKRVKSDAKVSQKENDKKISEYEADIAENDLRKAKAQKELEDLRKPAPPADKPLTAEQERILKKAEIETNLDRLRREKATELGKIDASNQDERMRVENMYDDRIAREQERLTKYL